MNNRQKDNNIHQENVTNDNVSSVGDTDKNNIDKDAFKKNILQYIPGFRSNTTWKKIIAIIYFVLVLFSGNISFTLIGLALPFFIFTIVDLIKNRNVKRDNRAQIIIFTISFVLIVVGSKIYNKKEKTNSLPTTAEENIEEEKLRKKEGTEKTKDYKPPKVKTTYTKPKTSQSKTTEKKTNSTNRKTEAQKEKEYNNFIIKHTSEFSDNMYKFSDLLLNPTYTDEWYAQLASTIAILEDHTKQVLDYKDVPKKYKKVHEEYYKAMEKYKIIAEELPEAIDNLDAQKVNQLNKVMEIGNYYTQNAINELIKLK